MNRQTLAEATSLHDGPVPTYLMEEIANATRASARDAEKVADFLVGRLNKTNLNVKLKALQLISYCIREGGPEFASAVREDEQEIAAYLQYTGAPDPVYGDEKYRRIRVASQEALVCLNDGFLSRSVREERPPPAGGNSWQSNAPDTSHGPGSDRHDDGPGAYNPNQNRQGGPWGPGGSSGAQEPSQQGSSSSAFRPPPYQDGPSQYGGSQPSGGGYNGPSAGSDNYNYGDNRNNGGNGGYGYNDNSGGYPPQQQQQQQQASGFDSWSTPAGAGGPSKSTGAGTWSSSGYQKKDQNATSEPRYNAASRRDNRPTVLVGHSLSFARPGAGSAYNPNVGGYNPNAGGYNPNAGNYNPNAGGFSSNNGGYNPNAGRSNSIGSGAGGFGSSGEFGSSSNSSRPNFVENTSRIMSGMNHMGFPTNTQPFNSAPASKLSKRVEVLKRIGNEAREKWDRRNMDKSMASSLADHDELRAGPQVMDHGHYQPTPPQVGAGDASRNYERGMIDNLCASAGLSRAPPADALKRFVDLAQTLDSQTIGDILLDKLEDPTWQVRLKGLHVVLALLESPGAEPYALWFEDNIEVVEELRKDPKPSVAAKARQVLQALGVEVEQQPVVRRQVSGGRAASQRSGAQAPRTQNDVDFLGFESLSIQQQPVAPAPAAPVSVPPAELNIFGSPQGGPAHLPPAPAQEVSLLDGFDPVGSTSSSQSVTHDQYQQQQPHRYEEQQQQYQQQYQQQQFQQQQYQQQYPADVGLAPDQVAGDARAKTLSHFGKDLFTIANSPRAAASSPPLDDGSGTPGAGQSAFNFM